MQKFHFLYQIYINKHYNKGLNILIKPLKKQTFSNGKFVIKKIFIIFAMPLDYKGIFHKILIKQLRRHRT